MTLKVSSVDLKKAKFPKLGDKEKIAKKTQYVLTKMASGETKTSHSGLINITKQQTQSNINVGNNINFVVSNKTGTINKQKRSLWSKIFGPSEKSVMKSLDTALSQIKYDLDWPKTEEKLKKRLIIITPEGKQKLIAAHKELRKNANN